MDMSIDDSASLLIQQRTETLQRVQEVINSAKELPHADGARRIELVQNADRARASIGELQKLLQEARGALDIIENARLMVGLVFDQDIAFALRYQKFVFHQPNLYRDLYICKRYRLAKKPVGALYCIDDVDTAILIWDRRPTGIGFLDSLATSVWAEIDVQDEDLAIIYEAATLHSYINQLRGGASETLMDYISVDRNGTPFSADLIPTIETERLRFAVADILSEDSICMDKIQSAASRSANEYMWRILITHTARWVASKKYPTDQIEREALVQRHISGNPRLLFNEWRMIVRFIQVVHKAITPLLQAAPYNIPVPGNSNTWMSTCDPEKTVMIQFRRE